MKPNLLDGSLRLRALLGTGAPARFGDYRHAALRFGSQRGSSPQSRAAIGRPLIPLFRFRSWRAAPRSVAVPLVPSMRHAVATIRRGRRPAEKERLPHAYGAVLAASPARPVRRAIDARSPALHQSLEPQPPRHAPPVACDDFGSLAPQVAALGTYILGCRRLWLAIVPTEIAPLPPSGRAVQLCRSFRDSRGSSDNSSRTARRSLSNLRPARAVSNPRPGSPCGARAADRPRAGGEHAMYFC